MLARSLLVMAAVRRVLLTKVVVRFSPLHRTTEFATKFVPSTVRVKPDVPTVALVGESEASVGTGLLTEKDKALDRPPPGEGVKT